MRIRDRLASAAAFFVEGAALMDPYAASALCGIAERRPPGHLAPPSSGRAGSRYRRGAAKQAHGAVGAR